eukprot:7251592-Heterocapsa_arctica.AAC.1
MLLNTKRKTNIRCLAILRWITLGQVQCVVCVQADFGIDEVDRDAMNLPEMMTACSTTLASEISLQIPKMHPHVQTEFKHAAPTMVQ